MLKRSFIVSLLFTALIGGELHAMPDMAPPSAKDAYSDLPPITGKVLEVLNSSGYTYLFLERPGGIKEWVAIPELYIKVGDEVELQGGVQMGEFTSKPLNKKFDQILFSGGPTEKFDLKRKESAHKGVNMNEPAPGKKKNAGKIVEGLKVEKAPGGNSYTIAEIMQKKAELQDKEIVVRGQVVKVSSGIMDRNWVHIKDASGGNWENKLVVTTKDEPDLGAVVTATGVFHNNVDFGGGYFYEIIMENAAVK